MKLFKNSLNERRPVGASSVAAAAIVASVLSISGQAVAQQGYGEAGMDGAIKDFIAGLNPLEVRVLDLSNDVERALLLQQFERAGVTMENDPVFRENIEKTIRLHAESGPADPGYIIFDVMDETARVHPTRLIEGASEEDLNQVGPVHAVTSVQEIDPDDRTFAASGIVSIPDQPQLCQQTLALYDKDMNPQGTPDYVEQVLACENVQLYAAADFVTPALRADGEAKDDEAATAVLISQWTAQDGTVHTSVMPATGGLPPANIISIDPNEKSETKKDQEGMIKFCFGRHASDCDYDPRNASAKNVYLPIVGSAKYGFPIADETPGNQRSVQISMSRPEPQQGGGCILQGDVADWFANYVTLSDDKKTISWNDPKVQFDQIDPCMPNGSIVYYNMTMSLMIDTGFVNFPSTFSISSAPPLPNDTSHWLRLPETRIYWSCLAEDAMITMADGTEKVIADVVEGDRIISDVDGTELEVSATFVGTEKEPLVELKTENGYSLQLTETHPVPTADGIRLARNLSLGDEVITVDGPSPLEIVNRVAYSGKVHNLSVIRDTTVMADLPHDERTFFANGIQVGDNEMQWFYDDPYATVATAHRPVVPVMSVRGRQLLEEHLGRPVTARLPNSGHHKL